MHAILFKEIFMLGKRGVTHDPQLEATTTISSTKKFPQGTVKVSKPQLDVTTPVQPSHVPYGRLWRRNTLKMLLMMKQLDL